MPKSVLAALTGLGNDPAVMEAAIAVARIEGGHITGQHTRVDTIGAAAMVEATFPQVRHDPALLRHIGREDAERAGRAHTAFIAAAEQYGLPLSEAPGKAPVSLGWMKTQSISDETMEEALYHDLVVMACEPELPDQHIRSVLMQSGRPLLLVPPNRGPAVGRTIAIGWKAGAEAARALIADSSWHIAQLCAAGADGALTGAAANSAAHAPYDRGPRNRKNGRAAIINI